MYKQRILDEYCPMCYDKNEKKHIFKTSNAFISVGELSRFAYEIMGGGGGIAKVIWILKLFNVGIVVMFIINCLIMRK